MVDTIDELKRKYADKYVVVDKTRPELARFRDTYGQVRTVNMSGRALVEFADYHLNIGWYDIDPMFLTVVDQPPPPKPKETPAKAAPAEKPASEPATKAAPKAAPAAKPGAGKPSTADILASLRGGGAAKAPAAPAPKPADGDAPTKPAAPAAKVDRSKMSVADMLAAARAGGSSGSAPAAKAKPPAEPEPVEEESPAEVAAAEPVSAALAKKSSGEKIDKKSMSLDQMIAWCREHDTK
jgi:hypothetical protein